MKLKWIQILFHFKFCVNPNFWKLNSKNLGDKEENLKFEWENELICQMKWRNNEFNFEFPESGKWEKGGIAKGKKWKI